MLPRDATGKAKKSERTPAERIAGADQLLAIDDALVKDYANWSQDPKADLRTRCEVARTIEIVTQCFVFRSACSNTACYDIPLFSSPAGATSGDSLKSLGRGLVDSPFLSRASPRPIIFNIPGTVRLLGCPSRRHTVSACTASAFCPAPGHRARKSAQSRCSARSCRQQTLRVNAWL